MSARAAAVLVAVASVASANEAFFKAEVVEAVVLPQMPKGTTDAAWSGVTGKTFSLVPQRTIRLNDKLANEKLSIPGFAEVLVRAALVGTELVMLLEWSDETPDVVRDDEVNTYADSAALQSPVLFGKGQRLPAISMGDEGHPVRLWLQRATKTGSQLSAIIATGFGSSTRQSPAAAMQGAMTYDARAKRWRAQFSVPVSATASLVPVSFALWDGGRLERAGNKRLSAWRFVRVPGRALEPEYVKAMAWGWSPGELGDPQKGKVLAEAVCASCHHLPGRAVAPAGLAPNLSDVGAIATASYLRDSIVIPSEVVLHGPNPNQHYDKSQPKDSNGAYPNNDGLRWFTVGPDGTRVSKMPSFAGFSAEQLGDLVAFLKTLDGKGATP